MIPDEAAIRHVVSYMYDELDVLAYNIADDDSATVSVPDWYGHVITVKLTVVDVTTDALWWARETD